MNKTADFGGAQKRKNISYTRQPDLVGRMLAVRVLRGDVLHSHGAFLGTRVESDESVEREGVLWDFRVYTVCKWLFCPLTGHPSVPPSDLLGREPLEFILDADALYSLAEVHRGASSLCFRRTIGAGVLHEQVPDPLPPLAGRVVRHRDAGERTGLHPLERVSQALDEAAVRLLKRVPRVSVLATCGVLDIKGRVCPRVQEDFHQIWQQ
jgi:hypothetical protein